MLAGRPDTIVLALPRGGVPVGAEIAEALRAPLFAFAARKLSVPEHEELAMGAITSGGKRLINRAVTSALHIPESIPDAVARQETRELVRRERLDCRGPRMPDIENKIIILVDDGVATGSTTMLAAQALRSRALAGLLRRYRSRRRRLFRSYIGWRTRWFVSLNQSCSCPSVNGIGISAR